MAVAQSLVQGHKQEWALTRAHPTETHLHSGPENAYYGIQIIGGKVPAVVKTTEILTRLCGDGIDTIDLNCGCPLDMVFKMGGGSALLDNHSKLAKMARGMVKVSGDIPVTCKIRMGISNGKNTAEKLLKRFITENIGVSAVTIHGRSRAQRYFLSDKLMNQIHESCRLGIYR
jgi:tRNA-dihydrouridine synthase 3